MNSKLTEITAKLNSADNIAVFCHVHPDGDAIGSGLALYHALKNKGKTVHFACEDSVPEKFSFLAGVSEIKTELPDIEYDLLVSLDCADITRLGAFAKRYSKFKETVNIDHHISNNGYAKYNYIVECPATCELLTDVLTEAGFEITEDIANALMLGLITDSGNFVHMDVTPKTFQTAAYLRGKGADCNKIYYEMFSRQPKQRALLYGRVMGKIKFALEDKLTFIIISAKDMEETGSDKSLTEGFVDFPLTIDGVEVSAALMEAKKDRYKVSLRSKGKVNVNAVATSFGGGGHILASGCMICGSLEDVIDKLTYAVYQNL